MGLGCLSGLGCVVGMGVGWSGCGVGVGGLGLGWVRGCGMDVVVMG